jgi:outer membrane protein assembly factor BamB
VFDAQAVYALGIHNVEAFDKNTGARLWSTPLTYPGGPPSLYGYGTAVAAGRVIIGDIDVFGLDPGTGAIVWRFAPRLTYPGERAFQHLATDGVTVYCGGVWGNVDALDAATGAEKWVAHVTTLPDSFVRVFNPIVDKGVVYVAFDDTPPGTIQINASAAAFDAATGRLLWSQSVPSCLPASGVEGSLASMREISNAPSGRRISRLAHRISRLTRRASTSITAESFSRFREATEGLCGQSAR